jgi:hypothetical protein
LAQDASGYQIKQGKLYNTENLITGTGLNPQVTDRLDEVSGSSGVASEVLLVKSADNKADGTDWRTPIVDYLRNPSVRTDRNCRCFETRGVPRPTSKLSPRAPAQMGRREMEREGGRQPEGDGRERWNPVAFVFVPRPGRVRLQ